MGFELPRCAANQKGECSRSDVVLAGEGDEHWAFICRTCGALRVVSKPRGAARAQAEADVSRRAQLSRIKPRKLYFS